MRSSSHPVWIRLFRQSGHWIMSSTYVAMVMISPRILRSPRAITMLLMASLRLSPRANRWPNWLSANSCTPPPGLTLK